MVSNFCHDPVIVSCGYDNKLLQMWCLKTAEMHYFTVLEAGCPESVSLGPNQSVNIAVLPLEALEESAFLGL